MTAYSDFGTPIEYRPPCPCGADIRIVGLAGASCHGGHVARLSRGPIALLEWPVPGAWKYEARPRDLPEWDALLSEYGDKPLASWERRNIAAAVRAWDVMHKTQEENV